MEKVHFTLPLICKQQVPFYHFSNSNSNSKDKDDIKGFATTFSWKLSDDEDYWLYFAKNYTLWDLYVKKVDLKITNTKSEKDYHNYIFYIRNRACCCI